MKTASSICIVFLYLLVSGTTGLIYGQAPHEVHPPQAAPSEVNGNWYSRVQQQLAEEEYQIRWQPKHGTYSSPNRAQNLRTRYHYDGFSVEPRVDSLEEWSLRLRIAEISKGGSGVLNPRKSVGREGAMGVCVSGGQMTQDHDGFQVQYQNDGEGMRQNIVVDRRPAGSGLLRVRMEVSGSLAVKSASGNRAEFADRSGVVQAKYGGLSVWDAKGQVLSSRLVKSGSELVIEVEDRSAEYPVMIDPLVMGGLSDTADWVAEGDQENAHFGSSVSSAGDVNGDGYSDVIIGAYMYDNGGETNKGRAYVYHGSVNGLSSAPAWSAEGNKFNVEFGSVVSNAGDVNGDGYSDVIIYDLGEGDKGQLSVYHGSATGLPSKPSWTVEGNQSEAYFGSRVSSAGDVNRDGYSDIIIGAPNYDNGEEDEGRVYIYHGSAAGLFSTPAWTAEANQANEWFGSSVSNAGDVNGDGYSDIIIGSYNYSAIDSARVYIYHGSATGFSSTPALIIKKNQANISFGSSVSSAGDVNSDGYDDIIMVANEYPHRTYVYHGSASGLSLTPTWNTKETEVSRSASSAGDVNGDGYSDIIIGAYSLESRAYVYCGSTSGLPSTPTWVAEGTYLGSDVSSAGDVNGDGYSDVIVAEPNYGVISDEGRAFVYHGSPTQGLSAEPPVSLSTVARMEVTPNPVSTSLTQVQLYLPPAMKGERSLKVYDLLGREVMDVSTAIGHTHEQTLSLDCTQLPKGCYLLTLFVAGMPSGVSKMIVVE